MIGTYTAGPQADTHADAEIRESPLGRYARWQLRDFVRQRAGILLLIAGLLTYPLLVETWFGMPINDIMRDQMRRSLIFAMGAAVTGIGVLLGTRGIVSEDREQGYHRFLFAKPVSAVRFYAQRFGIELAGTMAVLAFVAALYAMLVGSFSALTLFVPAVAGFTLFGGLTFLFSSLTRREWVWTAGVVAVTVAIKALSEEGYAFLEPLLLVLPPIDALGETMENLYMGRVAEGLRWATWPFAYGAAAFAAGLQVLKRRSVMR